MTEKTKLAGLSAELKKAKLEIKVAKARSAKELADIREWGKQQRSAINDLIKSGKMSADEAKSWNKTDNNQNKKDPKPKQGPKEPTKAEKKVKEIRSTVKKAKATKRRSGRGGGGTMTLYKGTDRTGLTGPLRRKMNKGGSVKKES